MAVPANEKQEAKLEVEDTECCCCDSTTPLTETSDLEEELATLKGQYDDLALQHTRLRADFDNYRRRTRHEIEAISRRASEGLIEKLLPVLDDLDRALEVARNTPGNEGMADGVALVQRGLWDILAAEGLERVPGVGEEFDPRWHEAVERADDGDGVLVVTEFRKGYRLAGTLLRPSMVKVGNGGAIDE